MKNSTSITGLIAPVITREVIMENEIVDLNVLFLNLNTIFQVLARVQFSGHQYAAESVCRDCRLTLSIFLRENTNFIKNNMLEMTIKQK